MLKLPAFTLCCFEIELFQVHCGYPLPNRVRTFLSDEPDQCAGANGGLIRLLGIETKYLQSLSAAIRAPFRGAARCASAWCINYGPRWRRPFGGIRTGRRKRDAFAYLILGRFGGSPCEAVNQTSHQTVLISLSRDECRTSRHSCLQQLQAPALPCGFPRTSRFSLKH